MTKHDALRKQRIIEYIATTVRESGYPPSVREIAAAVGLGLRLWLAGLAVWLVGHVIAVAVTRRDPAFLDVLSRHIQHKEHLTC